jgi:hypothetical protein
MNPSLEQRISRLEKNLRLYRIGFMSVLLVAVFFGTLSFKTKKSDAPDLVQAKAFQVVDDDGNILVEINKEDGNGQLSTFTPNGKRLISLFTTSGGAGGMNTFGKDGEVLFKVTDNEDGGGYMALFNGDGAESTELGVDNKQSGYLRINNNKGDKLAWITQTENGGGYFSLLNDGKEAIRLSTPAAGGRLGVYNNANTRVAFIGAQESKDGNVTVWNSGGNKSISMPQQSQPQDRNNSYSQQERPYGQ